MTVAGLLSNEASVQQLILLRYVQELLPLCWQSKPDQCTRWHPPVGCASMMALLDMILEMSSMHVCCR